MVPTRFAELRGRGADDRDGEVTGNGIRLHIRKHEERARDNGQSGFTMQYGSGSSLMDDATERAVRVVGPVVVVVEFQPKREDRHEKGNGDGEPQTRPIIGRR